VLGVLLPVLFTPIAFIAVLLTYRFYPWYPEGVSRLAEAVVPESGVKGFIVPIVLMLGLPVLPGSALAAAVSWWMLHSIRFVLLVFTVAITVQAAGLLLLIGILTLIG
jgi:hypothetical protein